MSNQAWWIAELTEAVGCCSPLVREPLSAQQALRLARLFGGAVVHGLVRSDGDDGLGGRVERFHG